MQGNHKLHKSRSVKLIELIDLQIGSCIDVAHEIEVDRENMAKFIQIGHQIMCLKFLREELRQRPKVEIGDIIIGGKNGKEKNG